jgi:hypothetical protein
MLNYQRVFGVTYPNIRSGGIHPDKTKILFAQMDKTYINGRIGWVRLIQNRRKLCGNAMSHITHHNPTSFTGVNAHREDLQEI